jgi:hypothetical protein
LGCRCPDIKKRVDRQRLRDFVALQAAASHVNAAVAFAAAAHLVELAVFDIDAVTGRMMLVMII